MKNNPKLFIRNTFKLRSIMTINLSVMVCIAAIVWGCAWEPSNYQSVRFGLHSSERAFYRLPPLPDFINSKNGKWRGVDDYFMEGDEEEKTDTDESKQLWAKANYAEKQGDLTTTAKALRSFLEVATEEKQLEINSANDRLAAMTALTQGASKPQVLQYLEIRREYEELPEFESDAKDLTESPANSSISLNPSTEALSADSQVNIGNVAPVTAPADFQIQRREAALAKLKTIHPSRSLQDNFAYLKAAILYKLERLDEAKNAFQEVASKYPRSEKREASLYMISVVAMKISAQVKSDCGVGIGDEADRAKHEANCHDINWLAALAAMNQIVSEYPHGKFTYATYENRAYVYRLGGELALGLADYYRMLGHPSDVKVRLKAKNILRIMGENYGTELILNQIEEEIANEPTAALAYAYHRIYNHAVDYSYEVPSRYVSDNYQANAEESERVKDSLSHGQNELERVANFATKLMQKNSGSNVSAGFVLRVAQAQFELQNFREALQLATKALRMNLSSELKSEALWIQGSAEHQRRNFKAAKKSFSQLVAEFPHSQLTEGARRLLAINAEDSDNLGDALEQYIALNYDNDVAYFIDVLMTPEQLKEFIEHHPELENRDVYWYSLGLRYLRLGQWEQARMQFTRIQTSRCNEDYNSYDSGPKNPKWRFSLAGMEGGVCSEWLLSDLKTTNDLARLEQQFESAEGDEAKAEAMYQFASYQYQNSQLLFYNPAIWGGGRHENLVWMDENNYYRAPNESQKLLEYMQLHENLSHAIPTYLELARLYPNTRAAKDGLYTAVVAHRRLASYNNYWRKIYDNGLQSGGHLVTFRDVKSLYPKYQMPRGEEGWEPITRTVNGGPGWAAPPKPLPKLTRTQKFKRYLKRFEEFFQSKIQTKIDSATESYTTYLWRCLTAILIAFGLIFTWYGSVLSFHFWKQRKPLLPAALSIISSDDSISSEASDSESRVEKIINDHL